MCLCHHLVLAYSAARKVTAGLTESDGIGSTFAVWLLDQLQLSLISSSEESGRYRDAYQNEQNEQLAIFSLEPVSSRDRLTTDEEGLLKG